jgi:hypothetical protein
MQKPKHLHSADRRKHHIIYKTTCLVTNRYYIGMHSTDDLNDGYMGSGKRLGYSLRKYGESNHKVEILELLPSREALVLREEEIVSPDLINDPMCMNLVRGGKGDWGWRKALSDQELLERRIQKFREAWQRPGYRENFKAKTAGRVRSDETKAKMRARWTPERVTAQAERLRTVNAKKPKLGSRLYVPLSQRPGYVEPDRASLSREAWAKHAADEARLAATKEAMSISKRGKIWVHLEELVKLITPEQEQNHLEQGWKRGTGNRQKPKEVSAETRAKLAEAARKQHAKKCLHKAQLAV